MQEKFIFSEIPDEFEDFQWRKYSEFSSIGGRIGFSLNMDFFNAEFLNKLQRTDNIEEKTKEKFAQNTLRFSYITAERINTSMIEELFDYKTLLKNQMFNLEQFVIDAANCNALKCKVWLARTGVGKRRYNIENDCLVGDSVSLVPYSHGQYIGKSTCPVNDNAQFLVRSENGKELGDICFGNNISPENDSNRANNEYWDIFRQLLIDGTIVIKSSEISKIVPHGTKEGRARKALIELKLDFELIGSINHTTNKIITPLTSVKKMLQKTANTMSLLGAIDYNRKCDIISGKENYNPTFEEIFPSVGFESEQYSLITSQNFKRFSLLSFELSPTELEEFWNVYAPTYCAIHHENFLECNLSGIRSVKTKSLLIVAYITYEERPYSQFGMHRDITLSIFRQRQI